MGFLITIRKRYDEMNMNDEDLSDRKPNLFEKSKKKA